MRPIEMASPDDLLAAGDPAVRQADGSVPFMQEVGAPEAVTWTTVNDLGIVPPNSLRLLGGDLSPLWTGPASTVRVRLQRAGTAPEPSPPVILSSLQSLTVTPASVTAGGSFSVIATLDSPWPNDAPAVIGLSWTLPGMTGPPSITIPKGQVRGVAVFRTPSGWGGGTQITAILGKISRTAMITVMAPLPPEPKPDPPLPLPLPLPPIGRTVDLSGATQAQIQAAIDAAQPGTGLFLGAGLYSLTGPSRSRDGQRLDVLNRDGITIYGAGASTVLDFGGNEGIWFRQGGHIGQGNVIRDMTLRNCHRAVCALDPQRLFMLRVNVQNCGIGYASERTSAFETPGWQWLTTIEDCVVTNWSGHGAMFHGGEAICRTVLHDDRQGGTYSHGLYIQAADNVLVEDVTIEGTSGHALQVYSDSGTHAYNDARNIVMRRVACRGCYEGITIVANGVYDQFVFEDISMLGTVSHEIGTFVIAGVNDWINNMTIKNLVLDEGGDGLVLLSGATGGIRNLQIAGLTVRNYQNGIVPVPSDWPNTKIEGSRITGFTTQNVAQPIRNPVPSGLVIG